MSAGFLLFSVFLSSSRAEDKPSELRIAKFKGDTQAAISYTFDDGKKDSGDVALPLFEARGLRMTFFIIVSLTPDTDAEALAKPITAHGRISWESLRKFAANGHEVGNHSWSHQSFINGPDEGFALQIDKAYDVITEKMGKPPLSFCFPGNGFNKKALEWALRKHVGARTDQIDFGHETFTAEKANEWAEGLIAKGKWGVTMSHSITEGGYRLLSPQVLADHLDYVKAREDKIWVDTFGAVALYTREQKESKASATWSDHAVTIKVETPLDSKVFNVPLTIVVPVPSARKASSDSGQVKVRSQDILVDIIPNGPEVKVVWE